MAHDVRWFTETLEAVCRKHFWVREELEEFKGNRKVDENGNLEEGEIEPQRLQQFLWPIKDPNNLWYSTMNQEVEGFYMEVERIDDV
jgi:hypothetical protein